MRAHVEEDYRGQIALYRLAALRVIARREPHDDLASLHARLGGLLYVFVRGLAPEATTGVLALRPTLEEVVAWGPGAGSDDSLLGAPLPSRREPLAPPIDEEDA